MIVEQGRVVDVDADSVWVATRRKSTCGSCVARAGCGQQLLARWLQGDETNKRNALKVRFDLLAQPALNPKTVQVDDQVEIGIQEGALVAASLLSYGLPLLGLLSGAGVAEHLALSAPMVILLGSVGLGLAALLGRLWQSLWRSEYFEPVLIRKLAEIPLRELAADQAIAPK